MTDLKDSLTQIKRHIDEADSILVLPHIDPDPDSLGAAYGIYKYAESLSKKCAIGLNSPLIDKFQFVTGGRSDCYVYPDTFEEWTSSPTPFSSMRGGETTVESKLSGRNRRIPSELVEAARILRQKQTPAETVLWECLKDRRLGNIKFYRQYNIGEFIADFYTNQGNTIIELDGKNHDKTKERDLNRSEWLEANGLNVIRIPNEKIEEDLESCLLLILESCHISSSHPSPLGKGQRVRPVDLAIICDVSESYRTGFFKTAFEYANMSICIDHHVNKQPEATLNLIDISYSSTCELIYEFYRENHIAIDKDVALAIYSGIVNDTGSFRYPNTQYRTHDIAGKLLEIGGFDPNMVYESIYENFTSEALLLQSKVINTFEFYAGGKMVISHLLPEFIAESSATESDLTGLVKLGSSIKGVDFHFFLTDHIGEGKVKGSFRSKSAFDVAALAAEYGGGGHKKAAGFTISVNHFSGRTFEEIRKELLASIVPKYENFLKLAVV